MTFSFQGGRCCTIVFGIYHCRCEKVKSNHNNDFSNSIANSF